MDNKVRAFFYAFPIFFGHFWTALDRIGQKWYGWTLKVLSSTDAVRNYLISIYADTVKVTANMTGVQILKIP